jgi:dGTPase
VLSERIQLAEVRGYEVVKGMFEALADSKGYLLMPKDVRDVYEEVEADVTARMRVICDFIAGATDRYAVEFYGRLHSNNAHQMLFKPV